MQFNRPRHIGDLKDVSLTLPQAAAVLGVDVEQVRKTVDRGWLRRSHSMSGQRKIRTLDGVDVVCIFVSHSASPKVRNELYQFLKSAPRGLEVKNKVSVTIRTSSGDRAVDVSLDEPLSSMVSGMRGLELATGEIDEEYETIRGTNIEAHRIAALIEGGMSKAEVLGDYPNLVAAQVDAAVDYARAHPKAGRPYPPITLKAALRRGRGGLEMAFKAARARA
jgi:hypothetical protein